MKGQFESVYPSFTYVFIGGLGKTTHFFNLCVLSLGSSHPQNRWYLIVWAVPTEGREENTRCCWWFTWSHPRAWCYCSEIQKPGHLGALTLSVAFTQAVLCLNVYIWETQGVEFILRLRKGIRDAEKVCVCVCAFVWVCVAQLSGYFKGILDG